MTNADRIFWGIAAAWMLICIVQESSFAVLFRVIRYGVEGILLMLMLMFFWGLAKALWAAVRRQQHG